MGTHFDFFRRAVVDRRIASISPEQHANRMLLVAAMRRHRLSQHYDKEWWHFTLTPWSRSPTLISIFPVR